MVTKDDIETMRILFGADINELCNQGRWKEAKEMERIRDRLMDALKEQEPCDNCISRQAVSDTIFAECSGENLDIDFAKVLLLQRKIKALPPVTPAEKVGRWIPVSERLPEKDRYTDFYKCLVAVAVSCTSRNTICDSFTAYFDGKHFYSHLYDKAIISGVKAWMPLPEPYKAETE